MQSYETYVMKFYKAHEPEKATPEHVKSLIDKYNEEGGGKGLGEMIYLLYKKYGSGGKKLASSHATFTQVKDEL